MAAASRILALVILLILGGKPVFAGDQILVHGEIVALHLDAGTMTVRTGSVQGGERLVLVQLPEYAPATMTPQPECLAVGRQVRVWGDGEPDLDNGFVATEIRGCGKVGCGDPTGVRTRLFRSRRGPIQAVQDSERQ